MKNAKKLLLLLLSLVLLIGVFAVTAFAEEDATATVVYPDGTTAEIAVGDDLLSAFKEENGAKLYYGAENTLFKATDDLSFKVDGVAIEGTTVPEAAAGKTITVEGFAKVYYTNIVAGTDIAVYNTTGTGLYDLLLLPALQGADIKLYADISTSSLYVRGYHGVNHYLDLNGHTLNITSVTNGNNNVYAFDVQTNFYLYSSQPGGVVNAPGCASFARSNDDAVKYHTNYNNAANKDENDDMYPITDTCNSGTNLNKHNGYFYFGERTAATGDYGKNITVYCQSLDAQLYGGNLYIFGGTFVQTGSAAYFIRLFYKNATVKNANFVITHAGTGVFAVSPNYSSAARTFTDCNFIYTGEGIAPIFIYSTVTSSGSKDTDAHFKEKAYTFTNCGFYNVMPACTVEYAYVHNYVVNKKTENTYKGTDTFKITYPGCSFGYSGMATVADLDAAEATVAYLAYIAGGKTVRANGTDYLLNAKLVTDTSTLKNVTWPDGEINYYLAGDATEAEAIVKAMPKYNTYLVSYEFAGENNTLFYVETPNIVVNVDGNLCSAVQDQSVPQKVYYTVETASGKTYNFDKDTYQADLRNLLRTIPETQTVTLYADVTFAATFIYGKAATPLRFDLNGHTFKITGNYGGFGFDVNATIYIYSSTQGAQLLVPDASAFFRTNDRTSYETTDANGQKVTVMLPYGQCNGYMYIGEPNASSTEYGKNLTIYCKGVNADMYQSSASIYGGTFVQYANTTYNYFLMLSRKSDPDGHWTTIKNATFIVNKKDVAPLHWIQNSNSSRTFTNCTFINTTDAYNPLFTTLPKMNNETIGTPTFDNCSFYNIVPHSNYQYTKNNGTIGTVTPVYKDNCRFGFSAFVPAQALQDAEADALYLIRGKDTRVIEVLGVTYAADSYLSATPGIAVTWENLADEVVLEYYAAGASLVAPTHITEWYDFGRGCKWIGLLSFDKNEIKDGENIIAIEMTAVWEEQECWAFTYLVGGELFFVNLADCGGTEKGVGDKFYELFDKLDNTYVVTLYSDLLLAKGMGLGSVGSTANGSGVMVPHYNSLENGSFTLDLNGFTFGTTEDFEYIDGSNSNSYGIESGGVFCIEIGSNHTLKILSSRPGARFEHKTACPIFCIGEQGSCHLVIEGENITFESNGPITTAFEISETYADITVIGGTYIYHGSKAAFSIVGRGYDKYSVAPTITDAEIILTNKNAIGVFAMHRYKRHTDLTVTNTKIHSLYPVKLFYIADNYLSSSSPADGAYNYALTLDGCTVSGVVLESEYKYLDKLTYTGTMFATDANSLLNAYMGVAPEGYVAAYKNDVIDGYAVKVLGYYLPEEAATVDWGFGITENWAIGSYATHENATVDKAFIYAFRPFEVKAENNTIEVALVGVEQGVVQMTLTLQSNILVNIDFGSVLAGATIAVDGEAVEDLSKAFTKAVAPNEADKAIIVIITIGDNVHEISLGIDKYAKAVLNTPAYAPVYNLTYAMVEYVRSMTSADFGADVEAPEGYKAQTVDTTKEYEKGENELLSSIAFQLGETIAIAIEGAEGKAVHLVLATGRGEWATITNGIAIFEELYVNEFYGDMVIEVYEVNEDETKTFTGETYTYSIENYYNAINESYKPAAAALYNYAYHADAYVKTLPGYPAN